MGNKTQKPKIAFPHHFFPVSPSVLPSQFLYLLHPTSPLSSAVGGEWGLLSVHPSSSLPFLPSYTSSCSCMGLYPGLLSLRINLLQCGSHVQAHSSFQGPAPVRALHGSASFGPCPPVWSPPWAAVSVCSTMVLSTSCREIPSPSQPHASSLAPHCRAVNEC